MSFWVTTVVVIVMCALGASTAGAAEYPVAVRSNKFTPADLTITTGDTVRWTNTDGTHNVVFNDGSFTSGAPGPPGWAVPRTFTAAGTFSYYCVRHLPGMTGVVRVTAGVTLPPPVPNPPTPAPPGTDPPELPGLELTLKLSDATPGPGRRIRVFGVVKPAQDGRAVQIQRRTRTGTFETVATARLRDDGSARSVYSRRLRLSRDAVLRARVAGNDAYAASISKAKRVDVRAPRRGL